MWSQRVRHDLRDWTAATLLYNVYLYKCLSFILELWEVYLQDQLPEVELLFRGRHKGSPVSYCQIPLCWSSGLWIPSAQEEGACFLHQECVVQLLNVCQSDREKLPLCSFNLPFYNFLIDTLGYNFKLIVFLSLKYSYISYYVNTGKRLLRFWKDCIYTVFLF